VVRHLRRHAAEAGVQRDGLGAAIAGSIVATAAVPAAAPAAALASETATTLTRFIASPIAIEPQAPRC
jgi:hypothetical protein